MEVTKKSLLIIVISLITSFLSWLLTNPDAMASLGLCTNKNAGCLIQYLVITSLVILLLGLLIDGLIWLVKKAFPNIDNPFEVHINKLEYTNNNEKACVSIEIYNKSNSPVENCFLQIQRAGAKYPERLSWSNNNPNPQAEYNSISLQPGDHFRSDLVIAWEKEFHAILSSFKDDEKKLSPGEHKLVVYINGQWKGRTKKHIQNYKLLYGGAKNLTLVKI